MSRRGIKKKRCDESIDRLFTSRLSYTYKKRTHKACFKIKMQNFKGFALFHLSIFNTS